MPTTYAHYLFGQEALKSFPEDLRKCILKHPDLYNYGVHGPDILFYGNPIKKDPAYKIGSHMHNMPAKDFFEHAKTVFASSLTQEEDLAYLLGFAMHFDLDHHCHSYIRRKEEVSALSHGLIEAQFDRFLILKQGHNLTSFTSTGHLHPSPKTAGIISRYYPNITSKQLYTILKRMVQLLKILEVHSKRKEVIFHSLCSAFHAQSFDDMTIGLRHDPRCDDSNLRLLKCFEKALLPVSPMAENLNAFLHNQQPLDAIYDYNFSYHDGYRDMPVLTLEEEKNYIL